MSHEALQKIIGTALTDGNFCQRLLTGPRSNLISDFDLTPEEQWLILAIDARTLKEFAGELDHFILQRSGTIELPQPPLRFRLPKRRR